MRKLCGLFAIDLRSLAAFRIAVGAILLVDVGIRSADFAAHYTESGILPLAALGETLSDARWRWSLYALSTADWWPAVLLGLTSVCGVLLLIGWHTRVATIAAWALVLSLHTRVPVIVNAGDTLLHALLFWAIFLPLGRRWSVDRWRRRVAAAEHDAVHSAVCSPASAAILLQMALLYICTGLYKFGIDDWWNGLSLYYVMSFDAYARPAAAWMLQHSDLLKLLTWGTLALEIGGPIAAFLPWRTGSVRLAVIASFALFHLGIELTMTVGLFSWVSMAGWLLFVPSGFWDWLPQAGAMSAAPQTATTDRRSICPGRVLVGAVVVGLLGCTFYWNATGFRAEDQQRRPAWTRAIMQATGLQQQWKMFVRPPKRDGWPRAVAHLVGGGEWDLLENKPSFNWKRRELPSALAPNHRWRKLYSVLMGRRHDHLRPYFCRYLARRFEAGHPGKLVASVQLYQVREITGAPGEEHRLQWPLLHQEILRSQGAFLDAAEKEDEERFEIHPGI